MIPRVVHQIWVGSAPPPQEMLATWQKFCHDRRWSYRLWTDDTDSIFDQVRDKIDAMPELCGKADIMRYVILAELGGVYADADTVVIRPLDDSLLTRDFCAYEHELVRPGLFANTILGFEAQSPIMRDCIEAIATRPVGPAFKFSGPYLLTEAISLNAKRRSMGAKVRDMRALQARHFYPVHWTAAPAPGVHLPRNGRADAAIYTKHVWCSSKAARATADQREGDTRAEMIALVEKMLGIDDESLMFKGRRGLDKDEAQEASTA